MSRRLLFLLTLGIGGVVILISLGMWQMQRLEWKLGIIEEMESRLVAEPVALPANPDPATDDYKPVELTGTPTGQELHVLSSGTTAGTGYRVISLWDVDGRNIMVDEGILPLEAKETAPATTEQRIVGNLIWPDDAADSSPAPDLEKNIWFARDVARMSDTLDAEPFMVALRASSEPDPRVIPVPVDTVNIRNNHLEYVITWFSLALVWAVMSVYFFIRSGKESKKV